VAALKTKRYSDINACIAVSKMKHPNIGGSGGNSYGSTNNMRL
jgi:hypothetical protein